MATRILGILNVTPDSYSDGGRFLDADLALEHGLRMVADGAAMVDVGAQSSHPDAADVPVRTQIERLEPVISGLAAKGVRVSVDTHQPEVARAALEFGASAINDITGARTPGMLGLLAGSGCGLVLMHSTSREARAEKAAERSFTLDWIERLMLFFRERLAECERAGVDRERIALDPGMGFFLSGEPGPSFEVLRPLTKSRPLVT